MFCKACGKEVGDEDSFCKYCGKQLKEVEKDYTISYKILWYDMCYFGNREKIKEKGSFISTIKVSSMNKLDASSKAMYKIKEIYNDIYSNYHWREWNYIIMCIY
ncbi:zinc ribbon domain-containing protein [Clostridium bowmanii]|uniref:zinc ribbon domain-containing protein n=1 Tax=Clostridium bowmanii TaxID=132925 RepID=UPI001C0DBDEE|nr:zinc ribbon domain-containing protein [Clostridium bowmanii]MBU3191195.1 zinc ribbon domain-containing protein [Clostridium bowmanii]MCA1075643.1 zinc ribbon domain-containing protein [Clostridium bowmanii]